MEGDALTQMLFVQEKFLEEVKQWLTDSLEESLQEQESLRLEKSKLYKEEEQTNSGKQVSITIRSNNFQNFSFQIKSFIKKPLNMIRILFFWTIRFGGFLNFQIRIFCHFYFPSKTFFVRKNLLLSSKTNWEPIELL